MSTSPAGWLGARTLTLDRVDSTSEEVWRRATDGAPHGLVVVAREQWAGRGRQGRSWRAGDGDLVFSWLLRPGDAAPPPMLSIASGLAVAEALDRWAPGRVKLKWPNDLLLDDRKVSGILLESRLAPAPAVVGGLGVNLRAPSGGWGALADRAISFEEAGVEVDAAELLSALLSGIESWSDAVLGGGSDRVLRAWPRWSALDGRRIRWEHRDRSAEGVVLGLDHGGGLRVDAGGKVEVLHSGEVHLKEPA